MVTITVNEHIQLRSYTADDAAMLFAAVNNSRPHLIQWLEWVRHTTREEHSLRYIKDTQHQAQMQESLSLGIFYDDKIIGGVGMHQWNHSVKKAQIGYWIAKEYEGKGIVTVCLKHFSQFLFDKVGLNKIEIHFSAANMRSGKVAERLGGKIEGIIRQSVLRNGVPEDVAIAGILKSEWKGGSN